MLVLNVFGGDDGLLGDWLAGFCTVSRYCLARIVPTAAAIVHQLVPKSSLKRGT